MPKHPVVAGPQSSSPRRVEVADDLTLGALLAAIRTAAPV